MAEGQTLPMLPWFARDYIAATRHLSLAERGAYTDLLFLSWEMGPLPDDPVRLARLIGVSPPEFKRVWPAIQSKFSKTEGGLINTRLEKHRVESIQRSGSARASAITRWERERSKRNANASANAPPNADANGHANGVLPSPSPSPYINPKTPSARARGETRGKPVSAAALLAPSRNGESEGQEAEAKTLRQIVRSELDRGASPEAIQRLMPERGLTLEQIAEIGREAKA